MRAAPVPGPGARRVVVHPDATVLAEAVAARLLLRIADTQAIRPKVHVVLTGGTVGIAALAAVAANPLVAAVDWSGVHLWWGDERFLPAGDPDRNETQAREALGGLLARIPPANIHAVPGPGPDIMSPDDAARAYAGQLAAHAGPGAATTNPAGPGAPTSGAASGMNAVAVPRFDVLLLGMGPDGHVASLFPGHRALGVTGTSTAGVSGSPKPPPQRVTLTFEAINTAAAVWVVAAGAAKADAVKAALGGAPNAQTPAAGVHGTAETLWLLDVEAAGLT